MASQEEIDRQNKILGGFVRSEQKQRSLGVTLSRRPTKKGKKKAFSKKDRKTLKVGTITRTTFTADQSKIDGSGPMPG